MKLPRVLITLIGIAILIAAFGCSTTPPAEVAPTPNIDATVEARVAQERAVDATVEARAKELVAAQPTATRVVVITEVTPTGTPAPTDTPTPMLSKDPLHP